MYTVNHIHSILCLLLTSQLWTESPAVLAMRESFGGKRSQRPQHRKPIKTRQLKDKK